jgi:hypothetical protein
MTEKNQAIRYIIYKVAKGLNGSDNQIEHFNNKNNFTLNKCLMLPYIITIANGKKEDFLNGIFENSFLPIIQESEKWVTVGDINSIGDFIPFDSNLLKLKFNTNTELIFDFQDSEFESMDIDLRNDIDHSISFFNENRYKNFAELDEEILKRITSSNSAFDVFLSIKDNYDSDLATQAEIFNLVAINSFYFISESIKDSASILA